MPHYSKTHPPIPRPLEFKRELSRATRRFKGQMALVRSHSWQRQSCRTGILTPDPDPPTPRCHHCSCCEYFCSPCLSKSSARGCWQATKHPSPLLPPSLSSGERASLLVSLMRSGGKCWTAHFIYLSPHGHSWVQWEKVSSGTVWGPSTPAIIPLPGGKGATATGWESLEVSGQILRIKPTQKETRTHWRKSRPWWRLLRYVSQ